MRIVLGVTDNDWASYLRAHEDIHEANFWVPSGRAFKALAPGGPFLFKTKAPQNQIVGGGFLEAFWELRVSEAWATFGHGNGVASERQLHDHIQRYRQNSSRPYEPDPTIGCIILRNLFFAARGEELAQPPRWGRSIVTSKGYDDDDPDHNYVLHAFQALQGGARIDPAWEPDMVEVNLEWEGDRYGEPILTRHRLGQGGFRLSVLEAYGNRCALTGTKVSPVLEAAHIKPYAAGGRHVVPNGLSLRADVHKLYDRGYLGVDPHHRLRVSPRLRHDFGNGDEFYERERSQAVIAVPDDRCRRPDREALTWHMDEVFLAS